MNVHLPTLQQDLVLLARVSKTYALAAPDLVRLLRNATTTAHTVTAKEAASCGTFFGDVTGLGKTSTRVLTDNEANIVRAPAVGRPLLRLLDTYSPEFPCLLKGAARYTGRLNEIFEGGRVAPEHDARGHPAPPVRPARPCRSTASAGPALSSACPTRSRAARPAVDFKNGTDLDDDRGATRMTTSRNTKTTLAAIKLGIFVLVSVIVTGTLTAIMGSFAFGSETEYKAMFTSASLIKKGDDVRVAGVTVGEVKDVEIKDRDTARGHLQGQEGRAAHHATRASIRFLNLVGARYMALEEGKPGAARLADGAHHPRLAHHAGAEPDRAVQRLPAAVPGAEPAARSTSSR